MDLQKADASALTAYAPLSAVNTSSEVDSKIAAALLGAVTTAAWTPPSSARRTPARWPPCSPLETQNLNHKVSLRASYPKQTLNGGFEGKLNLNLERGPVKPKT